MSTLLGAQNMSGVLERLMDVLTRLVRSKKSIYYNARITTEGAAMVSNPQMLARFSVDVPQAFISNTANWDMSVIRYSSTLHGLPALFVKHPIQAGSTPTATSYSFTLAYAGSFATQTVTWNPADASLMQKGGGYGDPYWYEYSYIRMICFVNAALSAAMATLIAAQPALAGVPAPFFQYDSTTATFTLWTPVEFLDSAATPVNLFCNEAAHVLLTGFPVTPTGVLGRDVRFLILQQPAEQLQALGGHNFVLREQLPGSLSTWTPVRRFVLTTSNIPIVRENTVSSTAHSASAAPSLNPNTTQQVISDYTPVMTRGDELMSGTIEYTPTAQYRITNLLDGGALSQIDLAEYWEDPLGDLQPRYFRDGGYGSYKLVFLEK